LAPVRTDRSRNVDEGVVAEKQPRQQKQNQKTRGMMPSRDFPTEDYGAIVLSNACMFLYTCGMFAGAPHTAGNIVIAVTLSGLRDKRQSLSKFGI
jgi:hypothetical protein